jgi:hypothetical protein
MKNFTCTKCGNRIFFENVQCLACDAQLGFDADTLSVVAVETTREPGLYRVVASGYEKLVRLCGNAPLGSCNWLTADNDPSKLCRACDLNRTIPNLAEPGGLAAWQVLERAKKRLVYCLLRYGLPIDATPFGAGKLTFDFVRNGTTGHLDGVITIDTLETDVVERERQRQIFDEPYRTLLGHLRHESGHFYWRLLIEAGQRIDNFRSLFGDERDDYASALQLYHSNGARADWSDHFVSAYASSHPWEDWAETWAHYLHMVSAVDTAEAVGMEPRAVGLNFGSAWPYQRRDAYRERGFNSLMERWIPLSISLNSLSRCMGHNDFYPFVIPAPAYAKLAFVHEVIRSASAD